MENFSKVFAPVFGIQQSVVIKLRNLAFDAKVQKHRRGTWNLVAPELLWESLVLRLN